MTEEEMRQAARTAELDALQFGEAGVQAVKPGVVPEDGAYGADYAYSDEPEPAAEPYDAYGNAGPYGEDPYATGRTTVMPGRAGQPTAEPTTVYAPPAAPHARQAAAPQGARIQGNAVVNPAGATPEQGHRSKGGDHASRLLRRAALWLVVAAAVIVGGAIALDFGKTFVQELGEKAKSAASSLADNATSAATDAAQQAIDAALDAASSGVSGLVGSLPSIDLSGGVDVPDIGTGAPADANGDAGDDAGGTGGAATDGAPDPEPSYDDIASSTGDAGAGDAPAADGGAGASADATFQDTPQADLGTTVTGPAA